MNEAIKFYIKMPASNWSERQKLNEEKNELMTMTAKAYGII